MKLECCHADTCPPDYWGRHHLPHVAIPVWFGMTCQVVKDSIRVELWQDRVMGSSYNPDDDKWFQAALEAVNHIETRERPFNNLENYEDVYAFFVFRKVEE